MHILTHFLPRSPVYLFPEDEVHPHYLGRIRSAFVDDLGLSGPDVTPQHNIEVNR